MPLKKVIIAKKKKRYHQTEGPCSLINDPWLYLDIDASVECPQVEATLDIKYVCLDHTYPYVKKYFRHLQCPTTVSDKETLNVISLTTYRELENRQETYIFTGTTHLNLQISGTATTTRIYLPSEV